MNADSGALLETIQAESSCIFSDLELCAKEITEQKQEKITAKKQNRLRPFITNKDLPCKLESC